MRILFWFMVMAAFFPLAWAAEDVEGSSDHPAISRYPDSHIAWYQVVNQGPYKIPVGPVTGYREIGDWIEIEGRVTRIFYLLEKQRTHSEVFANFQAALQSAGFDIVASGLDPASRKAVGGRSWLSLYYMKNSWKGTGPIGMLVAGTSSQGGAGAVFGKKVRANDTIYALVSLEQHDAETVAILIDIVETKPAQTGLVTANAKAMGKDMVIQGRTILKGLQFDHDKASLTPASDPVLAEIAKFLKSRPEQGFFVVGHTDATGTFAYNMKLASDRAQTVRDRLVREFGIDPARLEAHGIGPLSPLASNTVDDGRELNRRVELVERPNP